MANTTNIIPNKLTMYQRVERWRLALSDQAQDWRMASIQKLFGMVRMPTIVLNSKIHRDLEYFGRNMNRRLQNLSKVMCSRFSIYDYFVKA